MPMMVATKMAKRCHAWAVIPAGVGQNQIAMPTATARPKFFKFAPFHSGAGGEAAAALTTAGTFPVPEAQTTADLRVRKRPPEKEEEEKG